jgi:hypothetical protein
MCCIPAGWKPFRSGAGFKRGILSAAVDRSRAIDCSLTGLEAFREVVVAVSMVVAVD